MYASNMYQNLWKLDIDMNLQAYNDDQFFVVMNDAWAWTFVNDNCSCLFLVPLLDKHHFYL